MKKSIVVNAKGNLELSISDYTFSEYREAVEIYHKYREESLCYSELFEEIFINGSDIQILSDNYYFELGMLTSSPCFCDYDFWLFDPTDATKKELKEHRKLMKNMKVWHYPDYMIKNAFEMMLREGKVIFTLAS